MQPWPRNARLSCGTSRLLPRSISTFVDNYGGPVKKSAGIALFLAAAVGSPAGAEPVFPVIKGYGGIHSTEGAGERPDKRLHYKLVFNITKAPEDPSRINPSLEKVARFVNLLGADGVRPKPGDVVAIVHGAATPLVLADEAFQARNRTANPNLDLIRKLSAAGVEVHVCSQALVGHKIDRSSVDDSVQIDVGALVTLANLQLRGYALIVD